MDPEAALSLGVGALVGFQAGLVMSVLLVIWTIAATGVGHYEFFAAVTFIPVIIRGLSSLGRLGGSRFPSKRQMIFFRRSRKSMSPDKQSSAQS